MFLIVKMRISKIDLFQYFLIIKMNLEIPETLFDSIQIILKYQNTLLLKEISKDKGWKLSELKKDYLKDEDVATLVKKYNRKKKKEIKKKSEEPQTVINEDTQIIEPEPILETQESASIVELEDNNELVSGQNEANGDEANEEANEAKSITIPEPDKKVKKKKIKKIIKNTEIKCHKYTIEDTVFYINVENNNAYDKNMEFVGRMEGNMINFNEDEL